MARDYLAFGVVRTVLTATPNGDRFNCSMFCKDCLKSALWSGDTGFGAPTPEKAEIAGMMTADHHCESYHQAAVSEYRRRSRR